MLINNFLNMLRRIKQRYQRSDQLLEELADWKGMQSFLPGHFHSPIIGKTDLQKHLEQNANDKRIAIPGIDLKWDEQLDLLRSLSIFYDSCPFAPKDGEN